MFDCVEAFDVEKIVANFLDGIFFIAYEFAGRNEAGLTVFPFEFSSRLSQASIADVCRREQVG